MKQSRSFKEYIANRFENELYDAVSTYVTEHIDSLDIHSYRVHNIDSAELSDITVKSVSVDDLPGMRIAFDVILEAEVDISEQNRHDDYSDQCYPWFIVSCTGDLETGLNDFEISEVSVYDMKNKQLKPLDDSLVPYICHENLEDVATDFLKRNYPEALRTPMAIEPLTLTEKMGLHIELRQITNDFSIFGQIFFADCDTEYYDTEQNAMAPIHVNARTIYVDPQAYFLRNLGSVNNTIVHECVHWDKHRKAFELERLYNQNATQIKCQVVGGIKDNGAKSATDWMEWQANALTPRIQMPMSSFKIKASEFIRKYLKELQTYELVDVMEPIIDELALFFGVSRCAAKIRMVDAGYDEAIGVFTYIDGHYVQPHTFKKGSITKKQTFSVSIQDALIESVFAPKLREDLESGKYQFVDSHFCINSPKYITKDADGNPCLTNYARLHMDECCVIFDLSVKAVNKYSEAFYTECVLYRDADSRIIFEAHYSEDNKDKKSHEELIHAYKEDVLSVLKRLPNSFSGALDMLIKWSDMTEEDIAWESDLSTRTIQRLRNDDDQNTTMETVMQLCIGMSLPPDLSYALMEKSGNTLKANDLHFMYRFLLNSCYSYSLERCNEILKGQNVPLLGKTAKGAEKAAIEAAATSEN